MRVSNILLPKTTQSFKAETTAMGRKALRKPYPSFPGTQTVLETKATPVKSENPPASSLGLGLSNRQQYFTSGEYAAIHGYRTYRLLEQENLEKSSGMIDRTTSIKQTQPIADRISLWCTENNYSNNEIQIQLQTIWTIPL